MLKVYLDTCAIQRPLDTLTQTRIRLEAEAVLGVFKHIKTGAVELFSSTVLEVEIAQNPFSARRELGAQMLENAVTVIPINQSIAGRAAVFVAQGIKPADALHLAAAESAGVDYFCTCDDRFLKRAKRLTNLQTVVVSPLELIEVIENDS